MSASIALAAHATAFELATSFNLPWHWSSSNPRSAPADDDPLALSRWLKTNWAVQGSANKTLANVNFVSTDSTTVLGVTYPAREKGGIQFWMQPDNVLGHSHGTRTAVLSYEGNGTQ
ncbi:hypothetical protein OIO90_003969 [Microbotryomycetes sp. JL221]|nr:hypothetical protein OIO90_003969 [Microbotryomycetes sp. JL221]